MERTADKAIMAVLREEDKISKDDYEKWCLEKEKEEKDKRPALKAYSGMYIRNKGKDISVFQEDIERIVDLTEIKLKVEIKLADNASDRKKPAGNGGGRKKYLSDSNFLNLYNFAMVLNGRWGCIDDWREAKETGQIDRFIKDKVGSVSNSFKSLSLEYKLYNINQAKAFARYMDVIGCFYTDKEVDYDLVEQFSKEDMLKIGPLEHQRWLQEHVDMGWTYGTPERDERELLRQHKDMIPGSDGSQAEVSEKQARENYERLDKVEQDKDTEPMECMLVMLKMFDGLRIYRLDQEEKNGTLDHG